jgi:hypothetical protein
LIPNNQKLCPYRNGLLRYALAYELVWAAALHHPLSHLAVCTEHFNVKPGMGVGPTVQFSGVNILESGVRNITVAPSPISGFVMNIYNSDLR